LSAASDGEVMSLWALRVVSVAGAMMLAACTASHWTRGDESLWTASLGGAGFERVIEVAPTPTKGGGARARSTQLLDAAGGDASAQTRTEMTPTPPHFLDRMPSSPGPLDGITPGASTPIPVCACPPQERVSSKGTESTGGWAWLTSLVTAAGAAFALY
jgi:hypothetical protein